MNYANSTEDDNDIEEPLVMSEMFRHPFCERVFLGLSPYDDLPLPANERNMWALSATIRAKPYWWAKFRDRDIRAQWRTEAIGAPVPYGSIPLNKKEVDCVLNELAWYAANRVEENGIEASIFERIWQSDALVSDSLRSALLQAVQSLEDVPEDKQDWHPHADGQVLDLVDPSLFCLVYARSTVVNDRHDKTGPDWKLPSGIDDMFISKTFSWLPTDFAISEDGSNAKALAYINNLHPIVHANAYPVIEALVACFVSLWERVLAQSRTNFELRLYVGRGEYEWREPTEPSHSGESDDAAADDRPRILHLPPVWGSRYRSTPHAVNLKGRTLQVIVKLDNIILTPEKPQYSGGSWHVEGMVNEGIVALGIYCYDEENITESALAFRTAVCSPFNDFDDDEGIRLVYNVSRDIPCRQDIGSATTKQGRCIAFTNIYQHRVQPFELVDKSRPGHRKIVTLFLVDPELPSPRPSTSHVSPQQGDWMKAILRDIAAADFRGSYPFGARGLGKLPVEVIDMIVDQADWLMSRREAEAIRLELLEDRSATTE